MQQYMSDAHASDATVRFESCVDTAARLLACDLSVQTTARLMTDVAEWNEDDVWDAIDIAAGRAPREIAVTVSASTRRKATQPAPA